MKKIVLILGSVLVVAAIGAGAWWLFKGGSQAITPFDRLIGNAKELKSDQLADVYKHDENKACDYTLTDTDGAMTKSTFYLSNGRSYSVTVSAVEGAPKSYVLFKDSTTYAWQEGAKIGTKVATTADAQYQRVKAQQEQGTLPDGTTVAIVCKDWSPDETYFAVPTDVKFTEFVDPTQ